MKVKIRYSKSDGIWLEVISNKGVSGAINISGIGGPIIKTAFKQCFEELWKEFDSIIKNDVLEFEFAKKSLEEQFELESGQDTINGLYWKSNQATMMEYIEWLKKKVNCGC